MQFTETPRSRKGRLDGTGQTLSRSWFCAGVEDYDQVYALALANNPAQFRGLSRKSIDVDPVGFDTWAVEVEYAYTNNGQGFTPATRSFKISAARVKITQSLETLYRRTAADNANPPNFGNVGTAEDFSGAIGVTEDSVEGCEKVVPQLSWTKTVQRATCTDAYILTLAKLVGMVNDAKFYGYQAGELMYMGCDPTPAQGELPNGAQVLIWNLTHAFDVSPNVILETVGGIQIPRKRGHEYVWFRYKPTGAGRTHAPVGAYVEKITHARDFKTIGIGEKEGDPNEVADPPEGGGE